MLGRIPVFTWDWSKINLGHLDIPSNVDFRFRTLSDIFIDCWRDGSKERNLMVIYCKTTAAPIKYLITQLLFNEGLIRLVPDRILGAWNDFRAFSLLKAGLQPLGISERKLQRDDCLSLPKSFAVSHGLKNRMSGKNSAYFSCPFLISDLRTPLGIIIADFAILKRK